MSRSLGSHPMRLQQHHAFTPGARGDWERPTSGITQEEPTTVMKIPLWTLRAVAIVSALVVGTSRASAQGVTTGAISGTVSDEQNQPLQGVQIRITNRSTGAAAGTVT